MGRVKIAEVTIHGYDTDADLPMWDVRVLTAVPVDHSTPRLPLGSRARPSAFRHVFTGDDGSHRTWRLPCSRCPIDIEATDRRLYEVVSKLIKFGELPLLLPVIAATLSRSST